MRKYSIMSTRIASILSYLFHPLFLVTYMLFYLMAANPYLFSNREEKANGLMIISVVMTTVFFPVVSISLMKALDLIDSFEMKEKKERVGPLIVTSLFYFWLYLNVRTNSLVPTPLSCFVLGTVVALFISFFINNFNKISLHAVGMGGLVMALILIRIYFLYDTFIVNSFVGQFIISTNLIIVLGVILTGLLCTARLSKSAHNSTQIYLGLVVGMLAQVIGFGIGMR